MTDKPNPNTEELLAARDRLRAALDDFDDDAAVAFNETGERSDFWTDIEVNVNDLRTILAEQAHAAKDSPTLQDEALVSAWWQGVRAGHLAGGPSDERALAAARAFLSAVSPTHHHEAGGAPELSRIAKSLAEMVAEYVEGGINSNQNWRNGLDAIIERRLQRLLPAGGAPGRELVDDGPPVTLGECRPGLFRLGEHLGLKTEYRMILGKDVGGKVEFTMCDWPEAYVVESGEAWWGGTTTHHDRAELVVQPCSLAPHPPSDQQGREQVIGELCEALEPFAKAGRTDGGDTGYRLIDFSAYRLIPATDCRRAAEALSRARSAAQ